MVVNSVKTTEDTGLLVVDACARDAIGYSLGAVFTSKSHIETLAGLIKP
jgi:hypothetical protein